MRTVFRSLIVGSIGVLALAGCSSEKTTDASAPSSEDSSTSASATPGDPKLPDEDCKLDLKHTAERRVEGAFSCGDQKATIDEGLNKQGVAPIVLAAPDDRALLGYATLASSSDGSYTLIRQNSTTLCQTEVQPTGKVQRTECNETSGVLDTSVDSK